MTKEELQNYGHNKTTTTPETTKQEDFRPPLAHACFTRVPSRTRQFGECRHTHNNSHTTTHSINSTSTVQLFCVIWLQYHMTYIVIPTRILGEYLIFCSRLKAKRVFSEMCISLQSFFKVYFSLCFLAGHEERSPWYIRSGQLYLCSLWASWMFLLVN